MIIPIKCFTCGMVLADKYRFYTEEVRKRKLTKSMDVEKVIYLKLQKLVLYLVFVMMDSNHCFNRRLLSRQNYPLYFLFPLFCNLFIYHIKNTILYNFLFMIIS